MTLTSWEKSNPEELLKTMNSKERKQFKQEYWCSDDDGPHMWRTASQSKRQDYLSVQ